jgi:PAS domain S-box-containing protein
MTQASRATLNFEEFFRSLGTAYIIFAVDDPHFTVIEENQAHADIAMVKREDVIGKPVLEGFPDTSEEYRTNGKSLLIESLQKVLKTGKPDTMQNFNYDLKDPQGVMKTKYWEVTHYPMFEEGKVVAICQQTTDITEAMLARKELTVAQEQLEQALAYSEVGTWMWQVNEDKVLADKNLVKLFGIGDGMKQMEVPLQTMLDSIHQDDVERVKKDIRRATEDKNFVYENEYRTHDFNGDTRWLLARGRIEFDENDTPLRFLGLALDITERKLTENNLHMLAKANTQFPASMGYRQTLNKIATMIVPNIADWCAIDILEFGKIERVSIVHSDPQKVAWAKELQKKQGPVDINAKSGVPWVIRTGKVEFIPIITEEMLKAAAKNSKELKLMKEVGFHSAITAPLKIDGETIGAISFLSTESRRQYDENDVEIAQALANRAALAVYNAELFENANNEINERKKLQAELERLNSALEDRVNERTRELEKTNKGLQNEIERRHKLESQRVQHYIDLNKAKDEFISLASHQLRTPATGVKQYLGMVIEGMAGELDETQCMFLTKAYESNERQLTIVSDLLKVAQVDAGKVKLKKMKVDIAEILTDVIKEQNDTYAMRKQTIRFNHPKSIDKAYVDPDKMRMVLENMIDNASKYSDPEKAVSVTLKDDGESIVVAIKDNGVGVAPEDIEKLFEKFNRIHNHLSNHVGGSGLGLYWAKKIIDLHGGTIEVDSVLGKGSTFSVHLPKNNKVPLEADVIGVVHEK